MITIKEQALLLIEELADNYKIFRGNERIDDNLLRISVEDDIVYVGVARRETSSEAWDLFEFLPEMSNGILSMAYFESQYTITFLDKEWNEVESCDITINVRKERMNNLLKEL